MTPQRIIVIGSGVAGLTTALTLCVRGHDVTIITKARTSDSATFYAQGGVASQWFDDIDDDAQTHINDTLNAGAGLCDIDAVETLVHESKEAIRLLISRGAQFDQLSDGTYARTLEGGHHNPRIIHAGGDKTGAEVERALVASVSTANLTVIDHHMVRNLHVANGVCTGLTYIDDFGNTDAIDADHVVLSTGGAGQLFSVTTNPLLATGDGVALALDAGALCADLEFMQFHPTALHVDNMPRPLLSEALRGAGAVLLDENGVAFMDGVHEMGSLAPRDVVSRQIAHVLDTHKIDCVFLDARSIADFEVHYPTIYKSCMDAGFNPEKDLLPVSPAAHYYCGGVVTDLDGATSIEGLWAAGEVACNGVHGANRLASNSLLDGLVFGQRVALAIDSGKRTFSKTGVMEAISSSAEPELLTPNGATQWNINASDIHNVDVRTDVQHMMTRHAGIVRSAERLSEVEPALKAISDMAKTPTESSAPISAFAQLELANLIRVSNALAQMALLRRESRGCHTDVDFDGPRAEYEGRYVTNGSSRPAEFVSFSSPDHT